MVLEQALRRNYWEDSLEELMTVFELQDEKYLIFIDDRLFLITDPQA